MDLKLQLNGSAEGLSNYLKNFARVRKTLLLEVDVENKCFVAKGTVEDKSAVRYSAIPFENCGITVVSNDEVTDPGIVRPNRIYVGILNQLEKLIRIIDRFGEELKNEDSSILITVSYFPANNDKGETVNSAFAIGFKCPALDMKFECFKTSEFKSITDSDFLNVIYNVENETSFEISADKINDIISTTDIVKNNQREDALVFILEDGKIYVSDKKEDAKMNVKFYIGDIEGDYAEGRYGIRRETFIQMLGKQSCAYQVKIGITPSKGAVDRVLFDASDNTTKIVISTLSM